MRERGGRVVGGVEGCENECWSNGTDGEIFGDKNCTSKRGDEAM
jgi:hypothetical protein